MESDIAVTSITTLGSTVTLAGLPEDGYFQNLSSSYAPEIELLTFMSTLLFEGGTMVDVGANIGLMTVAAGKIVGGKGQIFSFEPSPQNFKILEMNIKLNDLSKIVRTYNLGLSDASRNLKLHYSNKNRGGAFIADMAKDEVYELEEEIRTKKLDDIKILAKGCDLLKVDIEGHEPRFLKGATDFIHRFKPATILEANPWCLDALSNITLPSYLKQIYELFPYIYAFDGQEVINVRERQTYFMHENIVKQRFQNLYCDSDKNRVGHAVAMYQRFLDSDKLYQRELENQNRTLLSEVESLKNELENIKSSRSHRIMVKTNQIIRRS